MAKCRGCGAEIVWIEAPKAGNPNETVKVPLDPKAPVYRRLPGLDNGERAHPDYMVSHFATCPKASSFSGSRR